MQQKLYLITQIFQGFISQVALQFLKYLAKRLGIIFKNINLTLDRRETGGKDFIMAHSSADIDAFVTAIIRGSFEYQGQKSYLSSRAYVPNILAGSKRKISRTSKCNKNWQPEKIIQIL